MSDLKSFYYRQSAQMTFSWFFQISYNFIPIIPTTEYSKAYSHSFPRSVDHMLQENMTHECPNDLCQEWQFLLFFLTNITNSLKYGAGEWIAIISFYLKKRLEFFKTKSDVAKHYKEVRRSRSRVRFRQISLHFSSHKPGAPNVSFRKISVRKTIWDLEFSEHLL